MPGKAGRVRGHTMDASAPMVRSVERAARIVYSLSRAVQGKRIADLAEELGLPKRTVRRLLDTLVAMPVADRGEESDRYYVEPATWLALTCGMPSSGSSEDTIHAALRDLERETGLRVSLATPAPRRRAMIKMPWYLPMGALGGRRMERVAMPVHATAAGLLYLATLSEKSLREWARLELLRFTEHTITSPQRLAEEVARVREQGYAVCPRTLAPDSAAVAVPVRDRKGRMFATISVGGPAELLTDAKIHRCLPFMRRASERLSRLVPGDSAVESVAGGSGTEGRGRAGHGRAGGKVSRDSKLRGQSSDEGKSRAPLVRTVQRAAHIIQVLWGAPEGKRLTDLSQEVGLHRSTTLRLLRTLVGAGAVYRDEETGLYSCGRVFRFPASYRLRDIVPSANAVQKILEDAAEATGMAAMLGIPDAQKGTAIVGASAMPRGWLPLGGRERTVRPTSEAGEKVSLASLLPMRLRELVRRLAREGSGVRFSAEEEQIEPIHATATGRLYLASLPPLELQQWMRRELRKVGEAPAAFRERLMEELARVRRQGYAEGSREVFPGAYSLGVPVRDAAGKMVAALVIVGPPELASDARTSGWVRILRSRSQRVSDMLTASREGMCESVRWGA